MSIGSELHWHSAADLTGLYRNGSISPVEVVDAAFARIDVVDPILNAFCTSNADDASAAAKEAEARYRAGRSVGPLDGVPIAIKDLTPTMGLRTTQGSLIHAHDVPDADAIIVERLRRGGAILMGKTTTSEFANSSVTESPLTGVTRNPWNPDRMSGGSSGGSAVAVATGCVPIAEGSDMGGSVRIPASFCGLVGLKPSLGRIPFGFLPNLYDSLAHHGPIARTVADAAAFLSVTAGPDDRDPLSLPLDRDLSLPLELEWNRMRIAYSPDLGFQSVDEDVVANTEFQIGLLQSKGAIVERVNLGFDDRLYEAGYQWFSASMLTYYGSHEAQRKERLDPNLLEFFRIGRSLSAEDLLQIDIVRTAHWRRLIHLFCEYDAIVCPTMPRTAPTVGVSEFDFKGKDGKGASIHFDMTFPFNIFGQLPAITIPSGLGVDGLPTGLQIVGRRYDERTILAIAAGLHNSQDWSALLRAATDRVCARG